MLTIGTTTNLYIQPPIVNTTTPGTTVLHVPPDNVAPSVSGAQVDNNTKGNNAAPQAVEEQVVLSEAAGTATFSVIPATTPSSQSVSAQSAFIAQLAGQDTSQETHTILKQYEKLVEFSNVKYKPSNAFKPSSSPASVFGSILHQEKAAPQPAVQAQAPVVSAPVSHVEAAPVQTNAVSEVPHEAPVQAEEQPIIVTTPIAAAIVKTQSPAITAYAASAARVASQSKATTDSLA